MRTRLVFAWTVTFNNNAAQYGGAIDSNYNSYICFKGNSHIVFSNNFGYSGGAIDAYDSCSISFEGNSSTWFSNNTANFGGAIESSDHSYIFFEENSITVFNNNAAQYGGAIDSGTNCNISFDGNSTTEFYNNFAVIGGSINCITNCYISFEGNSTAVLSNNTARSGGAIAGSADDTYISFKGNSTTLFSNNIANYIGGAIYSYFNSNILFEGHSTTLFNHNTASAGGAIYCNENSYISFEGNSIIEFNNNTADLSGGAIISTGNTSIAFLGNSITVFCNNSADIGGGIESCNISFEENSVAKFSTNTAHEGGAIADCVGNAYISFKGNSITVFDNNIGRAFGGAIYCNDDCNISFGGNSTMVFKNNFALSGGAIFTAVNSEICFKENSIIIFRNNFAKQGGAISSTDNSYTSFEDNSTSVFSNNTAPYGGGIYAHDYSDIIFDDNSTITFNNNNAMFGASIFANSKIIASSYFSILFNDVSAKWCNYACLPYTGQEDAVTIDSDGIVWCSNQKKFKCLNNCKNLEDMLLPVVKDYISVNITDKVVVLSSALHLNIRDISIIGHDNPTVICINGGRLALNSSNNGNLIIKGITWIGCGAVTNTMLTVYTAVLTIFQYNTVIIQKCSFQYSLGQMVSLFEVTTIVNINNCKFVNYNSKYIGHGAVIHFSSFTANVFYALIIRNCYFGSNEGAKSLIYFVYGHVKHIYLSNSLFYNNQGISIYLSSGSQHCDLHISGEVLFKNIVAENGAGIYIYGNHTIIFDKNSKTKFINNTANHNGAAIFLNEYSSVLFDSNSIVTFIDNKATNGTIYSKANSNVIFKAFCIATFSGNTATHCGSAIYSADNSGVTIKGNAKVSFSNNTVSPNDINILIGGTVFSENTGYISFEENSVTVFSNNLANFGAAIFSIYNSNVVFKDRSQVIFSINTVHYCGVLTSELFSNITFTDSTNVTYDTNTVTRSLPANYQSSAGYGAICTFRNCKITFSECSLVTFINNRADSGGAVTILESNLFIEGYSIVTFHNNFAWYSSGGAFVCSNNSNVTIKGNSNVTFNSNRASQSGGAIYLYNMCKITLKDNSTSNFIDNTARDNGGAILSTQNSEITFDGNSSVIFNGNMADNGGALYSDCGSNVLFSEFTNLKFHHNKAFYGAAILANDHCNILLTGNSDLLLADNEAMHSGGAGYFNYSCNFIMKENAVMKLDNNRALHGGAICIKNQTVLLFKESSTAHFYKNLATVGGGAVKVLNDSGFTVEEHASIKFTENIAQYGGAIFLDETAAMVNNNSYINFTNNLAKILGNSVYREATELCDSSCIINRTVGIKNEYIATPPNQLILNDQAICTNNDNNTQCKRYYIQNIMLGTEIVISACVLDYYYQPVDSTQFLVHNEIHPYYNNSGPKEVLISCDKFEGINIIGNQALSKSTNFSINITLNVALNSNWKQILINLIIELSPCHPGFWQYPNSNKCQCYNAKDIVFCSGNSSTIKRGYWFGIVTGKPTVTFCPINYCNFTCCATSNGYYHLSPVRANQCRSHRSGTACGSCDKGYTLSFDSTQCVHVKECHIGNTILVLGLTLLYWIVIIATVFSIMHFKVGIGHLYAITYYYSVVDLLLSQNLYLSNSLYTIINIMSSAAKIIPQFLGQICFIKNMSGIDQQFIHYMHPTAISLFLGIITVLARRSQRLSAFISKGIIHVICCLLLLSYTSLASTSLLLMRPLIFQDVDNVYTYVSPDIEYLHGRHLVYAIVAMIFTIVIVIGLPLLLALEPFLNSKINFIKIKPLLDQFQGCYKDKYRCFAGYYMICRLVIITTVIANSSNEFIFYYLLITACVIVALVHQSLRPYSSSLLNAFDGIILHFLVLVSVLPLVESFDNVNSNLLVGITFIFLILPVMIFVIMSIMINKEKIKRLPGCCYIKCSRLHLRDSSNEILLNASDANVYVNVIDDTSRRTNTTICNV